MITQPPPQFPLPSPSPFPARSFPSPSISFPSIVLSIPRFLFLYAKYLGVNISKDMRWNKHIQVDTITAIANYSQLGLVQRNVNINNREVKAQAYKSLVRPILEYSQTVWDPCTMSETKRLESVQRRAARFTMSHYHRTSMLQELN